jgi:Flp pilus assembly protein TadG
MDLAMIGSSFKERVLAFRKDLRGNMSMLAALSAVPLIASAGVAIDIGREAATMAKLQQQVDAAALAAASAVDANSNTTAEQETARNTIGTNYLTASLLKLPELSSSSPVVDADVGNKYVDVTVTANLPLTLSGVLYAGGGSSSSQTTGGTGGTSTTGTGTGSITLTAHARAQWADPVGPPACMTIMSPTATDAFKLDSDSQFNASTCDVNVLSDASQAAVAISSGSSKFKNVCVKGGVKGADKNTSVHLTGNCNPGGDPYAATMPAVAVPTTCDTNSQSLSGNNTIGPLSPTTPFVFCGDNTYGGSKVTLRPGLYIVKDGTLNLTASTVIGDGVTFYFPSNLSNINYQGKEASRLKAPTSGVYTGILMMTGPLVTGRNVTMKSADKSYFEGIIYAPKWNLTWDSLSSWTEQSNNDYKISKVNLVVNTFKGISISSVNMANYIAPDASGLIVSDKTVWLNQ